MKAVKVILTSLVVVYLLITGLYYLAFGRKAGTWHDDSGNWSRAFHGADLPPSIVVHRSYYTRSPHFTYEASYAFELSMPEAHLQEWIRYNRLTFSGTLSANQLPSGSLPEWFLAGRWEYYKVWSESSDRYSYRIYQNQLTGHVYIYDAS